MKLREIVEVSKSGKYLVINGTVVIAYTDNDEFVHFTRIHNKFYPEDTLLSQYVGENHMGFMPIEEFNKEHKVE